MERANPLVLILALFVMFALFGGAGWLKGGVFLAKHEGDAVHLLEIVLRMAEGQRPHLDFMTPIGAMAFSPIAWFIDADTGPGKAFVLAQLTVFLMLAPAVIWVGISRLNNTQAIFFGFLVTILVMAFVHGETDPTLSVSMHYNRWAWAVAFLVVAVAILPSGEMRLPALDGVIIGLGLTFMLLTKVTYAAAIGPPVLAALLVRREWAALFWSVLIGLTAMGAYTLMHGFGHWMAYLRDILIVFGSESRPNPGLSFREVIATPQYLGASLILLMSVVMLRQARRHEAGLILLLFVPGFFFITYQNFGNDPQWLYLVPVLLFALRPVGEVRNSLGWDMRRAMNYSAAVSLALAAPSLLNLAYSPFRHLSADKTEYTALLRGDPVLGDVQTIIGRAYAAGHARSMIAEGEVMAAYASFIKEPAKPVVVAGTELPICELSSGVIAYFDVIAQDLQAEGYGGSAVLAADVFSTIYWLYGDFRPLKRGAPWSYGTSSGLDDADYFLVPMCPLNQATRAEVVAAVEKRPEFTLTEVRRTELYILFRVSGA